jgi:hypothetical protein
MSHADQIHDCIRYQTDPRFSPAINRYGCRVFALLAIPQFVAGKCLSVRQIIDITERGRAQRYVIVNDNMMCGADEHWLINEGFRVLGVLRAGRQVGWDSEHIKLRKWQYMIAHWETAGDDGHFTLFDRGQKEIYDPHDPRQADYAIDKRKITRRLLYATWEV